MVAPPARSPLGDGRSSPAGTIEISCIGPREYRVVASGSWTPDYVDTHFGQLQVMLAAARGAEGVRVLVDLRAAEVQTSATADRVKFWTGSIYAASDRVAMLVASSLLRMQMRRVARIATCEIFVEEPAAREWLRAG